MWIRWLSRVVEYVPRPLGEWTVLLFADELPKRSFPKGMCNFTEDAGTCTNSTSEPVDSGQCQRLTGGVPV